jgi:hypothetical protein
MGIWEALEYLNTLVDDSDPDTDLSQIEHNLQTAEAIRRDGHHVDSPGVTTSISTTWPSRICPNRRST